MKDFDAFTTALMDTMRETINLDEEDLRKLGEVVRNHLFDLPGSKVLRQQLSDYDKFFQKVWYGFFEVSDSYQRLLDLEIYMRRFPFKNTRVTKVGYLRFIIEAYFEEIYLLKERLLSYVRVIQRLYRNSKNGAEVVKTSAILSVLVEKALEPLTKVRAHHVHVFRYSDKDVDRLKSLELLALNMKEINFRDLYEVDYREIRQKRLRFIKRTNRFLGSLLDKYFGALFHIVFDAAGKIIYPRGK